MTSISGDYSSLSAYSGTSLLSDTSSTVTDDDESTTSTTSDTDTVTLSNQALAAANRDSLGLPATGNLSLSDFETAAAEQEEIVSTLLASTMEELGIDADQQVSLSLNSDNEIEVENSFTGSDELEEALNANSEFTQAFTALSANNEILDFTEDLQEKATSTSLADYIGSDSTVTDFLSLYAENSTVNAAAGSLETLLSISHEETPYTYEYN